MSWSKSTTELREEFEQLWGERERAVLHTLGGRVKGLEREFGYPKLIAWVRRGWVVAGDRMPGGGREYLLGEVLE
jgi:hypothetical protein